MSGLLCILCAAIQIRPSVAPYIVAGDSVCPDHVVLRIEAPSLAVAIKIAQYDMDAVRTPRQTKGGT